MGVYSRFVFPRLMDWGLSRAFLAPYRRETLAGVEGEVLEIGFGTGLNLPHYPPGVKRLAAAEPNGGMLSLARRRLAASGIPVEFFPLKGEVLPMPAETFDAVVSTWTLCSVGDVGAVLGEARRVLRPGGRLFFLEHGASTDARIRAWQDRLTPVQKVIGDGCHLNREIRGLIEGGGFEFSSLREFYLPGVPRIAGYLYQGVAVKP